MKRLMGILLTSGVLVFAGLFLYVGPRAFMSYVSAPKSGAARKATAKEVTRAQDTWKARKLER